MGISSGSTDYYETWVDNSVASSCGSCEFQGSGKRKAVFDDQENQDYSIFDNQEGYHWSKKIRTGSSTDQGDGKDFLNWPVNMTDAYEGEIGGAAEQDFDWAAACCGSCNVEDSGEREAVLDDQDNEVRAISHNQESYHSSERISSSTDQEVGKDFLNWLVNMIYSDEPEIGGATAEQNFEWAAASCGSCNFQDSGEREAVLDDQDNEDPAIYDDQESHHSSNKISSSSIDQLNGEDFWDLVRNMPDLEDSCDPQAFLNMLESHLSEKEIEGAAAEQSSERAASSCGWCNCQDSSNRKAARDDQENLDPVVSDDQESHNLSKKTRSSSTDHEDEEAFEDWLRNMIGFDTSEEETGGAAADQNSGWVESASEEEIGSEF